MIDGPENDWMLEDTLFGTAEEVSRAFLIRQRRQRDVSQNANIPISRATFWIDTERLSISDFIDAYKSEMKILIAMTRGKSLTSEDLTIARLGLDVQDGEGTRSRYLRHIDLELAHRFSNDLLALKKVKFDTEQLTSEQWQSISSLLDLVQPAAGFKNQVLIRFADLAEELYTEKTKNDFLRLILT